MDIHPPSKGYNPFTQRGRIPPEESGPRRSLAEYLGEDDPGAQQIRRFAPGILIIALPLPSAADIVDRITAGTPTS